jgi:chromosomal replication initiator protein
MSEIISPYVFPILKHSSVNKKRHPFIKQRYTTLSKNDLVEEVCLEFKVDKNEFLTKKCRKPYLTDPRKLYCYIRVKKMGAKLVQVADELCKYDHTTVIHACKTFEPLFETDVDYREKCERVLRKLDINY